MGEAAAEIPLNLCALPKVLTNQLRSSAGWGVACCHGGSAGEHMMSLSRSPISRLDVFQLHICFALTQVASKRVLPRENKYPNSVSLSDCLFSFYRDGLIPLLFGKKVRLSSLLPLHPASPPTFFLSDFRHAYQFLPCVFPARKIRANKRRRVA